MSSATRPVGQFHLTDRIVMVIAYDAEGLMVACNAGCLRDAIKTVDATVDFIGAPGGN
jgi:hypothetical protein